MEEAANLLAAEKEKEEYELDKEIQFHSSDEKIHRESLRKDLAFNVRRRETIEHVIEEINSENDYIETVLVKELKEKEEKELQIARIRASILKKKSPNRDLFKKL